MLCGCLCRLDSEQSHQKTQVIWGNLSWGKGHHLPEKEFGHKLRGRCLAQSTVLWPVNIQKKSAHQNQGTGKRSEIEVENSSRERELEGEKRGSCGGCRRRSRRRAQRELWGRELAGSPGICSKKVFAFLLRHVSAAILGEREIKKRGKSSPREIQKLINKKSERKWENLSPWGICGNPRASAEKCPLPWAASVASPVLTSPKTLLLPSPSALNHLRRRGQRAVAFLV